MPIHPADAHVRMNQDPASIARLRLAATATALLAAATGALALLGWVLDAQGIKAALDMKANAALVLLMLGLSLATGDRLPGHRAAVLAARTGAFAGFALAAIVAGQFLSGRDLGVDELLFVDPGAVPPGRMALNTSICFMLVALAVITAAGRRHASLPPVVGLAVGSVGLLAVLGHVTGVKGLYGVAGATQMALPTALTFVVLGVALICSQPTAGFMRLLTSTGMGGAMVRRVLPLAVGGVVVLALLRIVGEDLGLYGAEVGAWLFASSCAVLITQIVWRAGWFLERADAHRRELADQLRELADRDPLTHLFNRRRFDEALAHQLAISRRYGGDFALLILDLDRFKEVNDTQGHQAGDRRLQTVARTLDSSLRASDVVARFGGDEFVALLAHTDVEACEAVAEKLADLLVARDIPVSVGAVACHAPLDPALRPEGLFSVADAALYEVKGRGGRGAAVRELSRPAVLR